MPSSEPARTHATGVRPLRGICFRHLTDLIQSLGTIAQEAFLIERAVIAFHEPIVLGVVRIADEHGNPKGMTKARHLQQGSRFLVVLQPKPGIAVQCNRDRQAVRGEGLGQGLQGSLSGKIGADMMSHQYLVGQLPTPVRFKQPCGSSEPSECVGRRHKQ